MLDIDWQLRYLGKRQAWYFSFSGRFLRWSLGGGQRSVRMCVRQRSESSEFIHFVADCERRDGGMRWPLGDVSDV